MNVSRVDKFGQSVLSYAILISLHKKADPIIEFLLEYGANLLVKSVLKLAIKTINGVHKL